MFSKCRHEWEKISETILESAFEQMIKANTYGEQQMRGINPFRKKYILVLQCKKCGELNKTVEENG